MGGYTLVHLYMERKMKKLLFTAICIFMLSSCSADTSMSDTGEFYQLHELDIHPDGDGQLFQRPGGDGPHGPRYAGGADRAAGSLSVFELSGRDCVVLG